MSVRKTYFGEFTLGEKSFRDRKEPKDTTERDQRDHLPHPDARLQCFVVPAGPLDRELLDLWAMIDSQ